MSILINHLVILEKSIIQSMMCVHLEPDVDSVSHHKHNRSNSRDHDDFMIELFDGSKRAIDECGMESNWNAETKSAVPMSAFEISQSRYLNDRFGKWTHAVKSNPLPTSLTAS